CGAAFSGTPAATPQCPLQGKTVLSLGGERPPKSRRQYVAARRRDHSRHERNPSLRNVNAEKLVCDVIHEDGGPLIHNGWEDEQHLRLHLPEVLPLFHSTPRT